MDESAIRWRTILGAIWGFIAWGVQVASAGISYAMHESIRERTTRGAVGATFLYAVLFVLGGAVIGRLTTLRAQWPKFVVGGPIGGALVWSYLTATWSFTARASSIGSPSMGVLESAWIGAGLGLAVGVLLVIYSAIRRAVVARRS